MREIKNLKIKIQKLFNAHRMFLILFFLILNSQFILLTSTSYSAPSVIATVGVGSVPHGISVNPITLR